MLDLKKFPILAETAESYATEVLILADAVGSAPVTLVEVMQDFLKVVRNPIIAGGFAVAHHGYVRGTLDVDVLSIGSVNAEIEQLKSMGYKHESIRISNGFIDLLTKSNKGIDFIHLDDENFMKSIVARTVPGNFLTEPVRVISFEDLIVLKAIAGRERSGGKDLLDLNNLLKFPYDDAYVQKWLAHFGASLP